MIVAGRRLAVDAARIAEVAKVDAPVRLPCDDARNAGVIFYRDELLAVVDLAAGGASDARPRAPLSLVVRNADGLVAILVDQVCGLESPRGTALPEGATLLDLDRLEAWNGETAPR
ncbi:MAG TPA: chemotaxis protein CheW [Methylomirabilota bacterium]